MENHNLIQCNRLIADIPNSGDPEFNLNLSAKAGTIISVIGSGHTGKKDWLKTIGGVSEPVSGELCLLGKNTENFTRSDWVKTRTQIAYLQSDTSILSAANALQNVMLPAMYHDLGTASEIKDQALSLLDEIAVECDLEILPAYLRKDQRFKIAVARALMLKPRALLLDNPFSVLDLEAANNLNKFLLNRVRYTDLLLILVTHDIKYALRYSDQIIFIGEHIHTLDKKDFTSCDIEEVNEYLNKAT